MLIELPKEDKDGPDIPGKLKLRISRTPYDDHFSILLPNGSEEYVVTSKAEQILVMYGVKDPEKILTHTWNFYSALVYVNDPAKHGTPPGTPPPNLPTVGLDDPVSEKRDDDRSRY
jgi:hypothetical protein